MSKQTIHVRHKDEIYKELLNTYKECVNRADTISEAQTIAERKIDKVRSSISDEQYGYVKALEWVLSLNNNKGE